METIGSFRTRVLRGGAVDVWAKGWRLGSQVPTLVPAVLGAAFLLSPFSLTIRALGCGVLLACSWLTFRLSRLGFEVDARGLTVHDVFRSTRIAWETYEGFVGERNEHEGRCVILLSDGSRVRSPGTLDPDEMDPYWSDGDASAIDQLNRLVGRLRRAFHGADPDTYAISIDVSDPAALESPGARKLRALG
jgi:hypothetical protein